MTDLYYEHLFTQHILVADPAQTEPHPFETLSALASLFHMRITDGQPLAQQGMIAFAAAQLGQDVPAPFYQGFPESVRALSPDLLLFDQIVHYLGAYGFLDLGDAGGHSLLEQTVERAAFAEDTQPKDFCIVTQDEAMQLLHTAVDNLLASTRPLNETQYNLICHMVRDDDYHVTHCASKNTAILLALTFRDLSYAKFLQLSDITKVIDELLAREYAAPNTAPKERTLRGIRKTIPKRKVNPHKLNLCNQDRKFITALIHKLFDANKANVTTCFERKKRWKGLLHHIHYKPRNAAEADFVAAMRGTENRSVYAAFEHALAQKDVRGAAALLRKEKGGAAVLRKLNYLVHHCTTQEDIEFVLGQAQTDNALVLLQLLVYYAHYQHNNAPRIFRFTAHHRLKNHIETKDEHARTLPPLAPEQVAVIQLFLQNMLAPLLKNRLGKVYLSPDMRAIALPLQETTAQMGFGTLTKGSRLAIDPTDKKLRAFTYWEQVPDIDLSVIALDEDWTQTEFSWRNMVRKQSDYITFSGDEVNGFYGGSEYFDIDLALFRQAHPRERYLVFCNNVYSSMVFGNCLCKAGYMLRDKEDSGQIFEPKTVQSAFTINADSSFAYLFALDLATNEFIWLNLVADRSQRIAGNTSLAFLAPYFTLNDQINLYTLIEMMASELVNDPAEAELAVSDEVLRLPEGCEQIHSYDFDKMLALMN